MSAMTQKVVMSIFWYVIFPFAYIWQNHDDVTASSSRNTLTKKRVHASRRGDEGVLSDNFVNLYESTPQRKQ